jgi:hypothetical protein
MSEVSIAQMQRYSPESELPENIPGVFEFSIATGGDIFADNEIKEEFLRALCEEYKDFIAGVYFTEETTGALHGQQLRRWDNATPPILWDPLSFTANLSMLDERYGVLSAILNDLYANDISYMTEDGKNFYDYLEDLKAIREKDIAEWMDRLGRNVYIRDIIRFRDEAPARLETMRIERGYHIEMISLYGGLLESFQQKDAQGVRIQESVNILTSAQSHAGSAADLQRQIELMERSIKMLEENEQTVRENSREAEAALTAFISELERNQETLRGVIFEYYRQINERNAANSVIYTSPAFISERGEPSPADTSIMRLVIILAGLTFIGFAIGFCVAFIRKYLPEKSN